jgi:FixJ family two-component response regulator
VVFVVDDDVSMREAIAGLIAANGLSVECFESAGAFLSRPENDAPACLVLDVRMPGLGGFELQRELAVAGRELPVIFITAHGDIPMAVRAMKAGAAEFLPKPFEEGALLSAVRQALERDRLALARRSEQAQIRKRRNHLTDRELQVMSSIGLGKLNKQIAAELGVSENTIKAHRRHLMKKMGAANFAELVLMMGQLR